MKKITVYCCLVIAVFALSSFSIHKFYMGIYQINYAPEKKMVQITARIFVDDLNKALEKKYKKTTHLGTEKETLDDVALMQKYLAEKLSIKINGVFTPMNFLSKEIESDVVICYLSIKNVSKVKTLETVNSILMDWESEQQNIVHFTGFGDKESHLFTESSISYVLNI
jgi:hypothetical protein